MSASRDQTDARSGASSSPAEARAPWDERISLVLCSASTSGRSRRAEGFLAQVLQRRRNHDTFRLFSIDADENPELLERLAVTEVPTLLVAVGGRVQARLVNPRGGAEIARFLAPWLK
jgi:thioredoxin family protein